VGRSSPASYGAPSPAGPPTGSPALVLHSNSFDGPRGSSPAGSYAAAPSPAAPPTGYGMPPTTNGNHHAGGYGAPPPPANGYGASPPAANGHHAMPPGAHMNGMNGHGAYDHHAAAGGGPRIDARMVPRPEVSATPVQYSPSTAEPNPAPPLNSNYVCADDALNPNPRFHRTTLTRIPETQKLQKEMCLPVGLHVSPIARTRAGEPDVPLVANWVRHESGGPPRCNRCGAWMNPFVRFQKDGEAWNCSLCLALNDYPKEDLCPLDSSNQRLDSSTRPEFSRCSVDFIVNTAPKKRIRRRRKAEAPPAASMPPPTNLPPKQLTSGPAYSYLIMLDSSSAARLCGVWDAGAAAAAAAMRRLRARSDYPVRFGLGFFDEAGVHVVVPTPGSAVSSVMLMTVPDADEPFAPVPAGTWARALDDGGITDTMTALRELADAAAEQNEGVGAGPSLAAVQTAASALAVEGGRAIVISRGRPTMGFGAIRDRQTAAAYGTGDEDELMKAMGVPSAVVEAISLASPKMAEAIEAMSSPKAPPGAKKDDKTLDRDTGKAFDEFVKTCTNAGVEGTFPGSCRVEWIVCAPFKESTDSATLVRSLGQGGGHLRWVPMDMPSGVENPVDAMKQRIRSETFLAAGVGADKLAPATGGEGEEEDEEGALPDPVTARAGILRVRASLGLEVADMVGPPSAVDPHRSSVPGFNWSSPIEYGMMVLPDVDEDTSVYVTFKNTGTLRNFALLQSSFLSTRPIEIGGKRKWVRVLRVHTSKIKVTDKGGVLFEGVDQDALGMGLVKLAARQYCREADLVGAREYLQASLVAPMLSYRQSVADPSPLTKLVLPDSLQLLPLYVLGAYKSQLFALNDRRSTSEVGDANCALATFNERGRLLGSILGASPSYVKKLLVPTLYRLTEWLGADAAGEDTPPPTLPCSSERDTFTPADVVLLSSGTHAFLYVGMHADQGLVAELLQDTTDGLFRINAASSPGRKALAFVDKLNADMPFTVPLSVVRPYPVQAEAHGMRGQHAPLKWTTWEEKRFFCSLVEDRVLENINDKSYVEFLCGIHDFVKEKMSDK